MYDKLIYGKSHTENIVSIEIQENEAIIFTEKDGVIESFKKPNKFWILANRPLNKKFVKLNGEQHYQYGIQFDKRSDFTKMRFVWKNESIYSIWNEQEAHMVKYGETYFKGMKVDDLSVLAFDIETTGLNHDETAKVLLIANTYRSQGKITRKMFSYDDFESEAAMLDAWCDWVRDINPSMVIGHNIFGYDIPYLNYCAKRSGTTLKLGRDGSAIEISPRESKFRKDSTQFIHFHRPKIFGREMMDTMFLSLKYDIGRAFPNYRLKEIIKHLGLEIAGRQFYDAGNIRNTYHIPEEWKAIKLYAEQDGDDALALYDKMYAPFFYMTQSIPKPAQVVMESASGSQLNSMLVRSYLQDAHSIPKPSDIIQFEGAISMGWPGIYRNSLKVDAKSLYPSIIIQHELFDKEKDPKAYYLYITKFFTADRLKFKALAKETGLDVHSHREQSGKIFINSLYGLGNASGLNFNSPQMAARITYEGREILKKSIVWATGKSYDQWKGNADVAGNDISDKESED